MACCRSSPEIRKIAVVGPLAEQTRPLIGNYAGHPTHIVSILDGLHAQFPECHHHLSCRAHSSCAPTELPYPTDLLTTPDGNPGLHAEYNEGRRGFDDVPQKLVEPH